MVRKEKPNWNLRQRQKEEAIVAELRAAKFISRDPLSGAEFSQGTNLYAYCQNNYLNLSDPTGKSWASFGYNVALGAAITGIVVAAAIIAAPVVGAIAAAVVTDALVTTGGLAVASAADTTVTTGAAALAIAGVASAATNTILDGEKAYNTGNGDQFGFDLGADAMGIGAGAATRLTALSDANVGGYDKNFGGKVSSGEISQTQNDLNWWATRPTDASAIGVAGIAGAGATTGCHKH